MSDLARSLEEALVEDPDDLASHRAYADFLQEQADPALVARGEFISCQLALEDDSLPSRERQRLKRREKKLLESHARAWLGALAPFLVDNQGEGDDRMVLSLYDRTRIAFHQFRRGWLHRLEAHVLSVGLARALRDAPESRLLQELVVEHPRDSHEGPILPSDNVPEREHSVGLCPLLTSPYLGNVRVFQLGFEPAQDHYESYTCHEHSTVVPNLLRLMPRLRELRLFVNGFDTAPLFALPFPGLRLLQLYHMDSVHRLQVLADNPTLRNLTHLLFHPHHVRWFHEDDPDARDGYQEAQGYLPLSVVRPLLHSPNLPSLTHLRLRVSSLGNEGCAEIVSSGILKRLKSLDLRHGRITEAGARTLAGCPDVRRLEWLDLDRNSINPAGVEVVKALGVPVRIDDQLPEEEVFDEDGQEYWDEEAEYLTEGEFE